MVFTHFSQNKKIAKLGPHSRSEPSADLQFIHAGGSADIAFPSRGASGRTMLVACGCGCPLVGGTFCAVSQKCRRTILGSDMGPGCFFLVLRGERGAGECVILVYPLTQKLRSSRMWRLRWGPSPYDSLRRPFEEFPFLGLLLTLFALGNMVHYFLLALYLAVLCPVFGCCLWSAENWILREMP